MTMSPEFLPKKSSRTVLFVTYPDMCLLDVTGPQTVFWLASKEMTRQRVTAYDCHTISADGGLVQAAEGVQIQTRPAADFDSQPIDTVIIPGSFFIQSVLPKSDALHTWIRDVSTRARRIASVCTGSFLLAKAGLLNGKRAATHWMVCDVFQSLFPDVVVDRESLFVREGSIWTSAGVSSCIDLSLALIEEDCGRSIAMNVAQEMVVFLKRPGGQSQFSQLLKAQALEKDTFDNLHLWIMNNLDNEELTIEMLAEQACMSPRNFARVYKKTTGRSPAKAVELFRLESARRLLEDSNHNIRTIARQCGFGDEERMRTAFLRTLAIAPSEYRERFATSF